MSADPSANVPEIIDLEALTRWIAETGAALTRVPVMGWVSSTPDPGPPLEAPFARYSDPSWRRHVLANLAADWICYPRPVDQVKLHRLQLAMHVFPRGFRTWWAQGPNGFIPAGYSGWFPISARSFAALEAAPADGLEDRSLFSPLAEVTSGESFVFIFNYSVAPMLKKTPRSKQLLQTLAAELAALPRVRLVANTVSPEGAQVAERFGMSKRATRLVQGVEERLYITPA